MSATDHFTQPRPGGPAPLGDKPHRHPLAITWAILFFLSCVFALATGGIGVFAVVAVLVLGLIIVAVQR